MKIGIYAALTADSVPVTVLARELESRGFESLWVPEHTHIPTTGSTPYPGRGPVTRDFARTLDPFVALGAAAGVTERLKLGTGICLLIQRDTIVTAKAVATLDHISGGRVIFGVGGGWNKPEMENHGTEYATRFRKLEEQLQALTAIWTREEAEFHGKYVDFDKNWCYPKPVQKPHPPVVMGGGGPTTFDRVIEFCQGWMPISRGGIAPPELKQRIIELKQRAEDAGRDPASIEVSVYAAPRTADVVEELLEAGAHRCIFHIPTGTAEEVREAAEAGASLMK